MLFRSEFNLIFFYLTIMFLIGFLSDLKKLNSPMVRLLLQLVLIILCVYSSNIILNETRVTFLDYLLGNYLFFILFFLFYILVEKN